MGWDSAPPTAQELAMVGANGAGQSGTADQSSGTPVQSSGVSSGSGGWDSAPPTPQELAMVGANAQAASPSWLDDNIPLIGGTPRGDIQKGLNALPMAGMIGGSAVGGLAGLGTGPGALATGAAGAGVGTALGELLKERGNELLGQPAPSRSQYYQNMGSAGLQGVTGEMGGQLIGVGVGALADTQAGQAAINGASKLYDTAASLPKWGVGKLGSIFTPVSEATTARYIADPASINSAPTSEAIYNDVLDLQNSTKDETSQAAENLSNQKAGLAQASSDARNTIQDQRYKAGLDLADAQNTFNQSKQALNEALRNHNLTSIASDVNDAVGTLKDQVVKGSSDAYDILGQSNKTTSVDPLIKLLQSSINSMRINGAPASAMAEQAIPELQATQQRLWNMTIGSGGMLTMPQSKQVLQGLDGDIDWGNGWSQSSFTPATNQALQGVRSVLDQSVKGAVPDYATAMEGVSRKAAILKQANQAFGSQESTISSLNGLNSQRGQAINLPLLKSISNETGADLVTPATAYLMSKETLANPSIFKQTIGDIPEAQALARAQANAQQLADPAYVRGQVSQATSPFDSQIEQAQAALDAAKQKQQLFSGVTPDSITGKAKALNGANQFGAQMRWGNIDNTFGTDFENQIQARNDLDSFSKSDTNGSRKAMIFGGAGAGIAKMVGLDPWLGYAVGSQVGGTLDKVSGLAFKGLLDGGMGAANMLEGAAGNAASQAPQMLSYGAAGNAAGYLPSAMQQSGLSPAASQPQSTSPDQVSNLINFIKSDPSQLNNIKNPQLRQQIQERLNQSGQDQDRKPGSVDMNLINKPIDDSTSRQYYLNGN